MSLFFGGSYPLFGGSYPTVVVLLIMYKTGSSRCQYLVCLKLAKRMQPYRERRYGVHNKGVLEEASASAVNVKVYLTFLVDIKELKGNIYTTAVRSFFR